jgi:hypothetical protein
VRGHHGASPWLAATQSTYSCTSHSPNPLHPTGHDGGYFTRDRHTARPGVFANHSCRLGAHTSSLCALESSGDKVSRCEVGLPRGSPDRLMLRPRDSVWQAICEERWGALADLIGVKSNYLKFFISRQR